METALGIDIGGTNVKVGFVLESGQVLFQTQLKTLDFETPQKLAEEILKISREQKIRQKFSLKGIGIGAPNLNYQTGTIISPPNLSWGTVPIKNIFYNIFNIPVLATNDGNTCALAEKYFGLAKGCTNFATLTLGTGLGSGFVVEGRLLLGFNGMAGEAGHIVLVPEGRECHCGSKGHAEAYVSSYGLLRTYTEISQDNSCDSVVILHKQAQQNESQSQKTFQIFGEHLGRLAALLTTLFSPEKIILSGGIAKAHDFFLKQAQVFFQKEVFKNFRNDKTQIVVSEFDEIKGPILGAASLVFHGI